MAFPVADIRLAVRGKTTADPTVHPRLIRDRTMLPKIDIAIQYFESMVGQERRAFEPEVLVNFFGDHKLARSMVACLARSYAFRAPTLSEEVDPSDVRRLTERHLNSPVALRLHLFDFVNDFGHGFARTRDREAELTLLADDLGLTAATLDRLLLLDAPEHAILRRSGPVPEARDVAAQFNAQTLLSLLRHSSEARLSLRTDVPEALECIERLSQANDVRVRCAMADHGLDVRLIGRQDALGTWGRHGHRLARLLVQLLHRGGGLIRDVDADLVMKQRRGRLTLTPELRAMLGWSLKGEAWWADESSVLLAQVPELLGLAGRGQRRFSLRRWPEPQAWHAGILVPDALIKLGAESRLVTLLRHASQAREIATWLPQAACGAQLAFIGSRELLALLPEAGAQLVAA